MNVKIFKLVSGEMIIGQLVESSLVGDPDTRALQEREAFTINTPAIVHFNGQGYGLMPMYPWANPKEDTFAEFAGRHVMSESDPEQTSHGRMIDSYTQLVSRIALGGAGGPGMGM